MSTRSIKSKLVSPDLPWCQDDVDDLGPCIMNFVMEQETFYRRWAQKWFENFQFIYGNQNIKWSQRYDFAVDVDFLRRESPLSQKAQTNIARTVAEALASLIYADLPNWEPETVDESSLKGKRFASISEKLLDAYMDKLCMDKEFASAALSYVTFGQLAAVIEWDKNAGRLMDIPQWKEADAPVYKTFMAQNPYLDGLLETATPALNSQGEPYSEKRWEPVLDPMGRQVSQKIMAGDVRVTMLTPFEYRREAGSAGMHKTKWVERIRLMDYDEYLSEYEDHPGKTDKFGDIMPSQSDQAIHAFAVRHFMRCQFTTPPSLLDTYRRTESIIKGSLFKHKVLVVEHYDKPDKDKWPLGRKVVVVNGQCTHKTEPNYFTNKLDGWHPFVEAQWMAIAPNSIATGPLNDVIAKNRETNVKDSLIATALRRNLGSLLLVKPGTGLDPQKISGEPAQIHEVNDPVGAARWLHDENPIPTILTSLKEMDKDEIYEVSGCQDAIRGDRSKGASSGYMLKQLEEREQKRLTPARKAFEYFVGGIGEKIVACLKSNVSSLDPNVMGYLKRNAAGEFNTQDVIAFLSTPLDYGIDIRVKAGSMAMKSKATQQATLQELAKGPAGQRLTNDASVLDTYLKYFDAEPLRDGSAPHRDRSRRENEIFMDFGRLGPDMEGGKLPVVMFEDDDDIHIDEHQDWAIQNSEELLQNEVLLQQYLMHTETHRIQKKEKMGELPAGASMQVPGMMAQVRQTAAPSVPVLYNQVKQQQQIKQQSAQSAPPGQPPQAPKPPQQAGAPGPKPVDAGAPSVATQGGKA